MQHAIHTMLPDTYEISHFHLLTHIVMKDDNNIDEEEEEKEEKTILMGEPVSYTQKTTFVTCNICKVLAQVVTQFILNLLH